MANNQKSCKEKIERLGKEREMYKKDRKDFIKILTELKRSCYNGLYKI